MEGVSMQHLKRTGVLAAAMALAVASPALSHHSHAMFDHSKELTITGTVTEFVFRNPHVFLYIDARNEKGETQNYWVEMSNLPNMIRRGIGQSTFKPGDKVTVHVHPLKDGRPGGSYVTITDAAGKTYE
jgi:uncharacterized cupredoxin-like copper-binding protein